MNAEGSGCDAAVAKNPSILDKFDITESQVDTWAEAFVTARSAQTAIPQAATRGPNFLFAIDKLGCFFGGVASSSVGPFHRINNILTRRRYKSMLMKLASTKLPEDGFIFLPLQFSADTNLAVRSAINNMDAVRIALDLGKTRDLKVVIKTHPAEREGSFCRELHNFLTHTNDPPIITSVSTTECLRKCACVMTINSTVGFEARLFRKEAIILQPAMYSNWSRKQMAQFALHYTVPLNMYDTAAASPEQWLLIKSRATP